mmetsp:Transcript_994/g.1465  ORF Transcript_994/g.1465 Transcript_994/m.1465 type:complete len:85 (+) Transcript_994:48-302(+)
MALSSLSRKACVEIQEATGSTAQSNTRQKLLCVVEKDAAATTIFGNGICPAPGRAANMRMTPPTAANTDVKQRYELCTLGKQRG